MINYNVPLNKKGLNANIKINVLEEKEMRRLGFTDYDKVNWYLCKTIHKSNGFATITFNLMINKENPSEFDIDILDEDWLQPYDYQNLLRGNPKLKFGLQVHSKVQEIMKELIDIGIIKGYILEDYI